ncbi:hypothetical protein EYF80_046266 [Liparis tanakae]|uniref:Uncharacterized protein n=1 Tax=Liparis tanakae TaxID=230148 RepID=A0A4Z2FS59_9TELE|nr:hypothetical protein EYF80_046266 [Liparis tanakae]
MTTRRNIQQHSREEGHYETQEDVKKRRRSSKNPEVRGEHDDGDDHVEEDGEQQQEEQQQGGDGEAEGARAPPPRAPRGAAAQTRGVRGVRGVRRVPGVEGRLEVVDGAGAGAAVPLLLQPPYLPLRERRGLPAEGAPQPAPVGGPPQDAGGALAAQHVAAVERGGAAVPVRGERLAADGALEARRGVPEELALVYLLAGAGVLRGRRALFSRLSHPSWRQRHAGVCPSVSKLHMLPHHSSPAFCPDESRMLM